MASPPNISTTGEPLDLNKTACQFTIMSDKSMCLCLRFKCKYFSLKAALKQKKGFLCGICLLLLVKCIVSNRPLPPGSAVETERDSESSGGNSLGSKFYQEQSSESKEIIFFMVSLLLFSEAQERTNLQIVCECSRTAVCTLLCLSVCVCVCVWTELSPTLSQTDTQACSSL